LWSRSQEEEVMAGTPIKRERTRVMREALFAEAVLRCAPGGDAEGMTPEQLMAPLAKRLWSMAMDGEATPTTLGAIREIGDRIDGRPSQEIVGGGLIAPTLVIEVLEVQKRLEKVIEGEQVGD